MIGYITVERFKTVVHVYMPTTHGPIVTVSLYGQDVGSYSDHRLISMAKEELKRKLDSEIFALVNVLPSGSRLLCECCVTNACRPQPTH